MMKSFKVKPPTRNAQEAKDILGSFFDYEHTPQNFQTLFQKIKAVLDKHDKVYALKCPRCGGTTEPIFKKLQPSKTDVQKVREVLNSHSGHTSYYLESCKNDPPPPKRN